MLAIYYECSKRSVGVHRSTSRRWDHQGLPSPSRTYTVYVLDRGPALADNFREDNNLSYLEHIFLINY